MIITKKKVNSPRGDLGEVQVKNIPQSIPNQKKKQKLVLVQKNIQSSIYFKKIIKD
jgi:hypothetical protein